MLSLRVLLAIMLLSIWLQPIVAMELPLWAKAASSYQGTWYPDRQGLDLEWQGKYLFSIGVDSLRYGPLSLNCEIDAREQVDGFVPTLNKLQISWHRERHTITLGTQGIGIGRDYWFTERDVMHPAYQGWMWESTRLHSVDYTFNHSPWQSNLAFGGNQSARAMVNAELEYQTNSHTLGAGIRGSTSDSHWHSPSLIGILKWQHHAPSHDIKADLMAKKVLPHQDKPAREEYAVAGAGVWRFAACWDLLTGAEYQHNEYAPKEFLGLHLALRHQWNAVDIMPIYSWQKLMGESIHSPGLQVNWHFYKECHLGLIYQHHLGPFKESRHALALQADLRFDM